MRLRIHLWTRGSDGLFRELTDRVAEHFSSSVSTVRGCGAASGTTKRHWYRTPCAAIRFGSCRLLATPARAKRAAVECCRQANPRARKKRAAGPWPTALFTAFPQPDAMPAIGTGRLRDSDLPHSSARCRSGDRLPVSGYGKNSVLDKGSPPSLRKIIGRGRHGLLLWSPRPRFPASDLRDHLAHCSRTPA